MIDMKCECCRMLSESLELAAAALDNFVHKHCIDNQRIAILQKKLDKAMAAIGYACDFLDWEKETVCADELRKRVKEIEDIKE